MGGQWCAITDILLMILCWDVMWNLLSNLRHFPKTSHDMTNSHMFMLKYLVSFVFIRINSTLATFFWLILAEIPFQKLEKPSSFPHCTITRCAFDGFYCCVCIILSIKFIENSMMNGFLEQTSYQFGNFSKVIFTESERKRGILIIYIPENITYILNLIKSC